MNCTDDYSVEYDDYDRRPPRRRHDDIPPSARVRKALLGLGEQV